MSEVAPPEAEREGFLLSVEGFEVLLVALRGDGWRLMGPTGGSLPGPKASTLS